MPAAFRVAALGLTALLAVIGPARTAEQRPARLALVIGEGAYPGARLPTAVADAGLMATALAQAGFNVTALADADAADLRATIAVFLAKARAAGPGVALAVYVAGDGLQYSGENWLVPVGVRIERGDDVPGRAVRLAELTGPIERVPATLRLFLFDLAREPSFARKGMPLAAGLALAEPPVGSVYAFNTAPGAVAPADVPPYGAYARAIAEAMQAPGLPLDAMLRRVRLRVGERTNGAAVPFDDGSAESGFSFVPGSPLPEVPPPAATGLPPSEAYSYALAQDTLPAYAQFLSSFPRDPIAGRIRAMAAARREALFWSEAVRTNTPRAFWTYLRRYPRGPHIGDMRRLLFALHAPLEPPPRFDIVPFEGLTPPPPEELAILDRPFLSFSDADNAAIPTPPASLVPPPRSAFFDTLPPPPVALAGALPLPLPVPPLSGKAPQPGRIDEPSVPGGGLVTSLGEGPVLTTTKAAGGALVSRLAGSVTKNVRTLVEVAEGGRPICAIGVTTGADGALTTTQVGPGGALLTRITTQDTTGDLRETTIIDADGRPIATTVTTAADIVTASALVPGRPLPRRFVLAPSPDAKGDPVVQYEAEPAPDATKAATAEQGAPTEGGPMPPLPIAPGLTGEAPKLNLPPPPPAPAFDSSAAPAPEVTVPSAALPPSVTGAASDIAAVPASSETAARLPSDPPLPPSRAAHLGEPRPKRRGGR